MLCLKREKIDVTILKNLVLKCNMKTLLNSHRYPFLAKHTCQTDRTNIIITLMTDVNENENVMRDDLSRCCFSVQPVRFPEEKKHLHKSSLSDFLSMYHLLSVMTKWNIKIFPPIDFGTSEFSPQLYITITTCMVMYSRWSVHSLDFRFQLF